MFSWRRNEGNIRLQIQFKLFHRNSCFAIGSKGDAIGRLGGVNPCGHGLLTVVDKDLHAVISLSGDTEITIEAGSNYEEAGFSAVDNYDGDITDKVETSAEVDTYTKGDTTIVYSVKDSSGNEAFTERVIHVEDTTAPQISLTGGEVYYIRMGDTYNEPGDRKSVV